MMRKNLKKYWLSSSFQLLPQLLACYICYIDCVSKGFCKKDCQHKDYIYMIRIAYLVRQQTSLLRIRVPQAYLHDMGTWMSLNLRKNYSKCLEKRNRHPTIATIFGYLPIIILVGCIDSVGFFSPAQQRLSIDLRQELSSCLLAVALWDVLSPSERWVSTWDNMPWKW